MKYLKIIYFMKKLKYEEIYFIFDIARMTYEIFVILEIEIYGILDARMTMRIFGQKQYEYLVKAVTGSYDK